jgi:tetrahydromethanopterin S-methyltransferase subunit G
MQKWFSLKIFLYSIALVIGLKLRFIMREWTGMFRVLAQGPNEEVENRLEKSIRFGRSIAYVYWIVIGSVAFLGATKFV